MDMLPALLWGLLAGSSLLVGAALGWFALPSARITAAVMAFGSGVLVSAIAFELMDEALHTGGLLPSVTGFLAGAVAFTVGTLMLAARGARHRKRSAGVAGAGGAAALAIALGSVFDGIPESMVIGLSLLDGSSVSLPIVAAIFLSNVPEGMSSAVGMKRAGMSKTYVFGLWSGIALLCGMGSLAGYALFDTAPVEYVAVAQGVAAGAMLAMIADTMIPEAFDGTHNASGLITALGFVTAFILSHTLGG
ncbi:putative integral membrane protein [Alcanivorax sp. S71-1-4]|jgi:zinc transporter, ZIP family|uniref:ZIP family metal transporter n=1 Tax=Alcanivorax sp. S71-1-4 TaxID=1177159 RepID=UPI0013585B08|nr:ZIP family zinc transporter [Alcanivorax sp. S71-1-4]KAF0811153.1 putative integral membrane protein [Alcanivorax sp. S71-1-4]